VGGRWYCQESQGRGDLLVSMGSTYVVGVVAIAIAITLTVVVRHDGEQWIVKTVSRMVYSIKGIQVGFVRK
jgi:hypothetical protein